ncbi:MAG TPA: hypothetical protein VLB44_23815 [Kofleriaceae bacterium]|nr:hypothetical protein [Kofleriaceae bacterium]
MQCKHFDRNELLARIVIPHAERSHPGDGFTLALSIDTSNAHAVAALVALDDGKRVVELFDLTSELAAVVEILRIKIERAWMA